MSIVFILTRFFGGQKMEPKATFPPEFAKLTPMLEKGLWVHEAKAIDTYMMNLDQDCKVLDLACGPGFASDYVARKFDCEVLGVDILPEMVATATGRYANEKVRFITGDMCDPNLLVGRKGAYSWVMCHHGLHHMTDVDGFLQNCYRLTKDDGGFLNLCLTREFGDPEILLALKKTLEQPKWQPYKKQVEEADVTPLYSPTPEAYPWILDTKVLFELVEGHGFHIMHKESRPLDLSLPFTKEVVQSVAVVNAVKALPEERMEEFLDDMVAAAKVITGEANPVCQYSTIVIVAQKQRE